jgi:hypothetical protein
MPIGFSRDIAALFRPKDIAAMRAAHAAFDLSSYHDVCKWSAQILTQLQAGSMPCDGPWADAQVKLFAQWIADGKLQ